MKIYSLPILILICLTVYTGLAVAGETRTDVLGKSDGIVRDFLADVRLNPAFIVTTDGMITYFGAGETSLGTRSRLQLKINGKVVDVRHYRAERGYYLGLEIEGVKEEMTGTMNSCGYAGCFSYERKFFNDYRSVLSLVGGKQLSKDTGLGIRITGSNSPVINLINIPYYYNEANLRIYEPRFYGVHIGIYGQSNERVFYGVSFGRMTGSQKKEYGIVVSDHTDEERHEYNTARMEIGVGWESEGYMRASFTVEDAGIKRYLDGKLYLPRNGIEEQGGLNFRWSWGVVNNPTPNNKVILGFSGSNFELRSEEQDLRYAGNYPVEIRHSSNAFHLGIERRLPKGASLGMGYYLERNDLDERYPQYWYSGYRSDALSEGTLGSTIFDRDRHVLSMFLRGNVEPGVSFIIGVNGLRSGSKFRHLYAPSTNDHDREFGAFMAFEISVD